MYSHLLANSRDGQTREFGHFQNSRNISKLAIRKKNTTNEIKCRLEGSVRLLFILFKNQFRCCYTKKYS